MDDSGHPPSGLAVYGWVEFRPDRWTSVLSSWLSLRKMLWREFTIPVSTELHATEYVNGRGRISKRIPDRHVHNGTPYLKDFGREVAEHCLETLRCTEGLRAGSVWMVGEPRELHESKRRLYASLVSRIERELSATHSLGLVVMDGDGSDTSYRGVHRQLKLDSRRIIEDAIHLDSSGSQLVQMADLVAYSAYMAVAKPPMHEFAWRWYERFLSERDPLRAPQRLL
ncbi:DUF3800 domain-containing protein [Gordonia humi]|nr:DUF3800 domain-containing protein [Gordonia humi]